MTELDDMIDRTEYNQRVNATAYAMTLRALRAAKDAWVEQVPQRLNVPTFAKLVWLKPNNSAFVLWWDFNDDCMWSYNHGPADKGMSYLIPASLPDCIAKLKEWLKA